MTSTRQYKLVALGGGTGLPVVLRSLAGLGERCAIVNVADDGRSSGVIRQAYGVPAVGDLRNSLVALAAKREAAELFNFRFEDGPFSPHPVGNLFLLAGVLKSGSLKQALQTAADMLEVDGAVYPATSIPVVLEGVTLTGKRITGQVEISRTEGIERIWLSPEGIRADKEAIEALEGADVIILSPGSLYSSLLPVLLTGDLGNVAVRSSARKIMVMNIANERTETRGYSALDYLEAIKKHIPDLVFDVIICSRTPSHYRLRDAVSIDEQKLKKFCNNIVVEELWDEHRPWVHSAEKLKEVWERLL